MDKLLKLLLIPALGFASFALVTLPAYAQTDVDETVTYDDYDWDYDWDYDYESTFDTTSEEELAGLAALFGTGALALTGVVLTTSLIFALAVYAYTSFATMKIAQKLEVENAWFAWVPILNIVLLFQMGDQNPWLILLALVPVIGGLAIAVLSVIAMMKICEKRGYEKLLGLLTLIPLANFVLLGVLAWGKKKAC